ncbi:MAG: septal ring lytic transglycosylase RlpA family protein [Spirochaetales bacterium]|nr:septal ring lytic transglycosylase RlpA family protein [Spirochaetales bacterium]MCF7939177.1 septal ring lytic transglycosylase RlpA family protein [Spirochaetales bacterium]
MKRLFPALLTVLMLLTAASGLAAFDQKGLASWYGGKFQGRLTANGEVFDTNQLTAAHKTLPFGTIVRVTNMENNESVEVRINDRGPFVEGRIIDLSRAAAEAIGMTGLGVAEVRIKTVEKVKDNSTFIVQVAAFSVADNAASLKEKLLAEGLKPSFEQLENGIIRVVFRDIEAGSLDSLTNRLAELGYTNLLVRKNG